MSTKNQLKNNKKLDIIDDIGNNFLSVELSLVNFQESDNTFELLFAHTEIEREKIRILSKLKIPKERIMSLLVNIFNAMQNYDQTHKDKLFDE